MKIPGVTRQNSEADHSHPSGAEIIIIIIIIIIITTTTTTTTTTYWAWCSVVVKTLRY